MSSINAAAAPTALVHRDVSVVPRATASSVPAEMQHLRLKTVDDVHAFFKHFTDQGMSPPFKFVYCAKVDTGLAFRPYDIVVVPRGQQPPEHFVVSPTAVVHVRPNVVSEVTMMGEWLRQSRVFLAIHKLTFFRDYLLRKHVQRWRANISMARYMQARTRLAKRFFLSKDTFAAATMKVKQLTYAMRLVQAAIGNGKVAAREGGGGGRAEAAAAALRGEAATRGDEESDRNVQAALLKGQTYPLRLVHYPEARPTWGSTADAFLDSQRQQFAAVTAVMASALHQVVGIVSGVVETVASRAMLPDLHTMDELDAYVSKNSQVEATLGAIAKYEKGLERQARKRELKRKLIEYDLVQPWIRLIDAIVAQELFRNVTTSFQMLSAHLNLPTQGLHRDLRLSFEVGLVFKGDDDVRGWSLKTPIITDGINSNCQMLYFSACEHYISRSSSHGS
jgi:hypothetical protein